MKFPANLTLDLISTKSSFAFEGETCAATLHTPRGGARPFPAVLMVHGWGGGQEVLTRGFYQRFVQAGFAVMEFDYPCWGASSGLPRNDINPWRRVRAADAALAHLKQRPQVDAQRIVLWGSSFGGGHVAELAADHPDLLGAIIQVPMLDGLLAVRAVPLLRLVQFAVLAIWDWLKPGKAIHIPTVAPAGEWGTMDRDEAFVAIEQLQRALHFRYDNRVTARSLLTMGLYRPYQRLAKLRIPMLVIGAERDTVAPLAEAKLAALPTSQLQLHKVAGHHFNPYFEPVFSEVISKQLAFLHDLLAQQPSNT